MEIDARVGRVEKKVSERRRQKPCQWALEGTTIQWESSSERRSSRSWKKKGSWGHGRKHCPDPKGDDLGSRDFVFSEYGGRWRCRIEGGIECSQTEPRFPQSLHWDHCGFSWIPPLPLYTLSTSNAGEGDLMVWMKGRSLRQYDVVTRGSLLPNSTWELLQEKKALDKIKNKKWGR